MVGTLSEPQQKIVTWLEQEKKQIIHIAEIASFLSCSETQARPLCIGLCMKKQFASLGNGQYLFLSFASKNKHFVLHPLVLGSYLVEPYYFSYQTATAYHGFSMAQSSPVYLVTTQSRSSVEILDISYKMVRVLPRKFFGYESIKINDREIFIADKEKAVIDSLEKIWYAGGLFDVICLLKKNIKKLDIEKMVDYTVQMQSSTLIQRLGYLLDRFDVSFDENFMQSYSRSVLSYLDPYDSFDVKPVRNEKWNLMINIPDTVFEEKK